MLVLPTIADDHRNFRSLKERSQHQLNWLRLQPTFQINPGHLAQFFDGPGRTLWSARSEKAAIVFILPSITTAMSCALSEVSPGLRSVNVRTICLWMDLLNSPRFTDRTSGISNNRFNVGPAPWWRSTIRSSKKSASEEMDSDWILESSSSKAL